MQQLRKLIDTGYIAPGTVDERDIRDVRPSELQKYAQCHFFAGIGVWSYALRQAGWPDDEPVWTGSCPCQPFSAAGKGKGFADERHVWPTWHHLISQCSPFTVFGEQVASKDGLGWLDLVQTDLEASGYTSGATDLCAAGFGAPHIRQRLWFVAERLAYTDDTNELQRKKYRRETEFTGTGAVNRLANTERERLPQLEQFRNVQETSAARTSDSSGIGQRSDGSAHATNGFWRNADWLGCRDEKWRPVEPGTFPLVDGAANRMGRLKTYGNAIVAPVAQGFIEAYMEVSK